MPDSLRPPWHPYLVAVIAVAAAYAVRLVLLPGLFAPATFLPAFMAVLLASWHGGFRPGLLATVLSVLASAWWLFPPLGSFAVAGSDGQVQMTLFVCLALAMALACESLHRARRRAATMHADLDELRRMDKELRRLADALAEEGRRKDRFLAMLAHELRNPLAPIRTAVELLRRPAVAPEDAARAREVIDRQVVHMVRMVDDLLDVGRITHDRLALQRRPVTLADVVAAAIETSAPFVAEHGHRLDVTDPLPPLRLDVDPMRATQVLANLLHNAAKFTPAGGRLALRAHADGDMAVLVVADNGIGIGAPDVAQALEMFGQVDVAVDRPHGGLGIGLSVARRLVEMHGGRLALRAGPGGIGTEVEVRLPLAAPTADEAAVPAFPVSRAAAEAAPRTQRVLVADDNVDSALMLSLLLEAMGHEVRTVHDGAAALVQAEAFSPDIVLLDLGMPELDGYATCRRLRQRGGAGPGPLIAAVTGWGQDADRVRSREAGFDLHLVKPLDPAALAIVLAEAEARRAGVAA